MTHRTYPHSVKFGGKYYAPNTPIVTDVGDENGAPKSKDNTAKRAAKPSSGNKSSSRKKR